MGCCFSDNKDSDDFGPTESENEPLLSGHADSQNIAGNTTDYQDRNRSKGDEQSALQNILQSTARVVIDVTSTEIQNVEQHEFHDKSRTYSNRLTMVMSSTGRVPLVKLPTNLNNSTAPHILLSAPPVSLADIQLITSASEKASRSLKEIKVQHKEDLVVPFGVP